MTSILLSSLWVDRSTRQRADLDWDHVHDLANSFQRIGQLTAVMHKPSGEIIFGEHRFEAAKVLGWTHIEAKLEESDDDDLHQAMELEENVKRIELEWKDKARAIQKYHLSRKSADETWTQEKTGEALGIDVALISKNLAIAKELDIGNEKVESATQLSQAYNVLARRESRERDSEAVKALSIERIAAQPDHANLDHQPDQPRVHSPVLLAEPDVVRAGNFLTWASTYEGPKFNFLHCDFPYGVNIDKSDQAGSDLRGAYEDTPETYWALLECLAENWNRLMLPSAHIMFWFSMDFYTETHAFFKTRIPSVELDAFPLYWHKSDGKGILPDPNRGPRRIVETCLFGRSGDRKVVQSVANGYSCPTFKNQAIHLSEKPEPMLRHFFRMLVDENTAILDPTAGGGSALRAADSLGATHIQGLELNPEYAEHANMAFRRAKTLRRITAL